MARPRARGRQPHVPGAECLAGIGRLLPCLPPRFTVRFSPPSSPPDGGHRVGAKWLRFPAIRRYQEWAAANPRTLKALVATFVPLTKVEGFPATPSLEPSLTSFFGVRQANMIAGRRPTLASPRDQYVARQADRVHQCAFQAAANNIALLSNSVVTLVERSTTLPADEAE